MNERIIDIVEIRRIGFVKKVEGSTELKVVEIAQGDYADILLKDGSFLEAYIKEIRQSEILVLDGNKVEGSAELKITKIAQSDSDDILLKDGNFLETYIKEIGQCEILVLDRNKEIRVICIKNIQNIN